MALIIGGCFIVGLFIVILVLYIWWREEKKFRQWMYEYWHEFDDDDNIV